MLSNKPQDHEKILELQQSSRQDQPFDTKRAPTIKSQHEIPIDQKPPPYHSSIERANFLSLLHFAFGVKLIRKVNALKNRTLKIQDLEPIGETESCETLEKLFTKYYKEYSKKYPKKRRVMTFVLLKIFKKNVWVQAIWQLLYAIGRLMVAYFVYLIIFALKNYSSPVEDCYLAMIGFSLCSILAFYANNQWNFNASYMVNRMQSGMLGMLFRKINKLGPHSVNVLNLGKLINITANDLNNLDRIHFVVSLLIAPIVIGAAVGLLWYFWGASSWVGIGYLIFVWIIQWSFAYPTTKYRRGKSGVLDERIRMLEESIGSIRLVKMYGWEWNCINTVEKMRADEIKQLKTFCFMDSVPRAFTFSSHWIAAFLIYVTYTAIEGHIDASQTFATILILTLLRQSVEINIFNCFLMFIEMKLLFTRTMSIMDLPEISLVGYKKLKPLNPENSIEFEDYSAFWEDIEDSPNANVKEKNQQQKDEERPPILSNINLEIKKGSLTMVVGKVASGKSSLLLAITNEMPSYAGLIRCQGSYAYVGQNPILFYGPLRDSVVFGRAYDENLFWRVLDVCCLSEDVRKLPDKEMSEIGERGIILTGSQKTRLVMARALYNDADIYLLDDPLVGIDVKLAKKIFRDAIMGYLKEKTVVVVTHRYRFLHYADKVVLIDKGEIVAEGMYHELKQHEIFGGHDHKQEANANEENTKEVDIPTITTIPPEIPPDVRMMRKRMTMMRKMSIYQRDDEEETMLPSPRSSTHELAPPELDEGLFVEEEQLDDGRVTFKGYYSYFKAMFTKKNFLPLIFLFIAAESIAWLFLVMVGKWARGEYSDTAGMIVVGCISLAGLVLNLLKFPLYYNATLNVSHRFHNYMLRGMFLSSFKFFDKNSLGRIISRFSNEIGILDKFLIGSLLDVLEGLSLFLNYLFTLWILEPWILVSAAIGVIWYVIVYWWGRRTFNQTRGLELITRAPLYSLFLIEVEGLTIIRARKQTEDMIKTFYRQVDDHSRANIAYMVSVRFLSFLIGYAVELIVIGTFCVFIPVNNTPLSRGYFINVVALLPTTMQWILQSFIVLNLMMSSVARIFTFCENRSSKGLLGARKMTTKVVKKEEEWPKTGEIEVKNVNMRYTNKSERFLKDLSFNIKSGEKVAVICGSRGGVSHTTALLLRMFEIDKVEGEESFVKIDGMNIKDVDDDRLRKAVLVIPQNTYMIGIFSGTIRRNLDPWEEHSDEEIWKALEEVELKEYVENLKGKLNTTVGKGVSVFSVGQKNLLSIARAMLKGGKIIIQDETTTHVDTKTNHIVQRNIEKLYKDCTLITITHRLDDIAKYDKVLLIENGEKIEFDEPYRLLVLEIGDTEITNKKGAFASLVKSLGTEMQEHFMKRSMKHYYKKHGLDVEKEEDVVDADERERQ